MFRGRKKNSKKKIAVVWLAVIALLCTPHSYAKSPPPGTGFEDVPANILIMIDTSGSMSNIVSSGDSNYPYDVAFDSLGNSYVGKYFDRIEKFNSAGEFVLGWGEYDGTSGDGKFDYVYAVEVSSEDKVYVADRLHGRVQVFDTEGNFLDKFSVTTSSIRGIAMDSNDNVYAVNGDGKVEKFTKDGTPVGGVWGNSSAYLIATDSSDNVYVSKYYGYEVEKYDSDGNFISDFNTSFRPFGIEVANDGTIYLGDLYGHEIYQYSAGGSYLQKWGSYGGSDGQFRYPRGIESANDGTIYVADYLNHRIQTPDGTQLFTPLSPETRLDQAKKVIKDIVSNSDLTEGANFGLMEWNSSADMVVPVSATGAADIYTAVDSLSAGGGTYLDEAMDLAESYMLGASSPMLSGAWCQQDLLIVISDGYWVDNTASTTAEDLFNNNDIKTFVVGFQTTGNSNYVELSQKGGTYPDSPLYADNWQHLYEVLSSYILQFITSELTFTVPTIIPGIINDDHILQSTFTYKQNHQWKGHLYKYALAADGTVGSTLWDAGDRLNNLTSANRNIWTVSTGLAVSLNNFTTTNIDRLRPGMEEEVGIPFTDEELTDLINFVRGDDVYNEFTNDLDDEGTPLLTGERWKMADVYHAEAVVVGPPADYSSDEAHANSDTYYRYVNGYINFKNSSDCGGSCQARDEVIYVGSNSGMLHAFDSATGDEKWAFIPPSVLPKFKDVISLEANKSNSIYGVDGSPTVKDIYYGGQWRTVIMSGLRQGGHSYFALDITDPDDPQHLFTIAHSPLNDQVSYWNASGTRTDYDTTGTVPAAYDYSGLGESWSNPLMLRLNIDSTDTWTAVIAGGFNNAVNPNYGTKLFVLDLENGGIVIQALDIGDEDAGDNIISSVPPTVTAITPDTTTLYQYTGAMIYVNDLEGKLWKVNLSDQGTMYDTTKVFDAESTNANGRYLFHQMSASVVDTDKLALYFGSGNMQDLGATDAGIQNRGYSIYDSVFPGFADVATPTTATQLADMTSAGTCPGTNYGWYIDLNSGEKVTAKSSIKNGTVFFPRYTPNSGDACEAGTSVISEHLHACGETVRTTSLGSGMATEVVAFKDKVYIGISSDADEELPSGWVKQGNLIIGTPSSVTTGDVTIESWWEDF